MNERYQIRLHLTAVEITQLFQDYFLITYCLQVFPSQWLDPYYILIRDVLVFLVWPSEQ